MRKKARTRRSSGVERRAEPGLLCCDFRNDSARDGLASLLLPEEEEDEDEAKRELKLPPLPTWLLRNGCCVGSTEGAKTRKTDLH